MEGLERGLTYGLSCLGSLIVLGGFTTLLIERHVSPTRSTPHTLIPDVLKAMNLKKGEKFVDLGSGDGTFIIEAVKQSKVKGYAFDISPTHIMITKFKQLFMLILKGKRLDLEIFAENFLTLDLKTLSDFDVFYLNQSPTILKYFEPKAKELAEKGLRIYTFRNKFPNLKPAKEHKITEETTLYEY